MADRGVAHFVVLVHVRAIRVGQVSYSTYVFAQFGSEILDVFLPIQAKRYELFNVDSKSRMFETWWDKLR